MYSKNSGQEINQEILRLLKKMNEKLDHLQVSAADSAEGNGQDERAAQAKSVQSGGEQADAGGEPQAQNTMWNLTQIQYELSNELFEGLTKLKKVIHEGEKYANRAKSKYQR